MLRSRAPKVLAVALLAACVAACGKRESEEPVPTAPSEDLQALADGNNAFAADLYKKLAETQKGNVLFSPYSARTALAMTYAGARGQTAEEMRKTLHFTLPDDRLHPACGATAHQLRGGKDRQYELNVANSLWGQKGFPFQPEFLDLTRRNYAAGFREADFVTNSEAARQEINGWVEEQTKDRIKELLKPRTLDERTRLVLVNALYFKGKWAQPFDAQQTADDQFRAAPGQTVPVRMMRQSGEFRYGETDDAQILYLPYRTEQDSRSAC